MLLEENHHQTQTGNGGKKKGTIWIWKRHER